MEANALKKLVLECGASVVSSIKVKDIPFRTEFRKACERNLCGFYNACWVCPPAVGPIDALITRAKKSKYAIVFQSVYQLEDSFDIEGMSRAAKEHNALTQAVWECVKDLQGIDFILGAGSCTICKTCAKRTNEPCRFPDRAVASLEAYGIAVSELAELCGLRYTNGPNTVTYFGIIFHNNEDWL